MEKHDGHKVQHVSASIARVIYADYWDSYFKFSFVRNPWDLIVSHYSFFLQRQGQKPALKDFVDNIQAYNQRMEYVDPYFQESYEGFQLKHLSAPTFGSIELDFLGRFENLQEDFDVVCDKIKLSRRELPHVNKSDHKPYWECYDIETREVVRERYSADIEYFDYHFENDNAPA